MVDIVDRSEWGARAPTSTTETDWSARTEFVVHYSAGPPDQSPKDIQRHHMDSNGWSDIGYNFLVDTEGTAYEGRGWLVVGAHATGHNTSGIGVCFIGGDSDTTSAAKNTIRALYHEANRKAGRTLTARGHRDVGSTSCPGDSLHQWVADGLPEQ
ncbi:N-acetylmuramoyl-L-alanine amidase [Streptomonospora mangrovi]|uniref:N-acetylmuramoyl-L-alanine amidase n=1 Tax=Streptomonospora mangrovi TaxID=2883123 RepID=UPI002FD7C3A2